MITNPLQKKAYDAVARALPFSIDPSRVTVAGQEARGTCAVERQI